MDAYYYNNDTQGLQGAQPNQNWSSASMMRADGDAVEDQLETAAKNLLAQLSMTTKRLMQVRQCMHTLQEVLNQLGPTWRVAPFGSAASGLCTCYSDLDATFYREDLLMTSEPMMAIEELKMKLLPLLEQHPRFKLMEQIWSARIPILKLKFYGDKKCRGSIDVDLSCHNTEPLANTKLLRAYSKMSPMVRSLVLVIKHWAKVEQVSGAADSNLSSYSITLMAIYYMLVSTTLRMPCLPTEAYCFPEIKIQQKTVDTKWTSPQSVGALVQGFFNFFAYEFMWGEEVVSVRVGKRLSAGDEAYSKLRGRFEHGRLHIEDPYLWARNLNCALGQQQEYLLRTKLIWTSQLLQQGQVPQSLHQLPPAAQTAQDEMAPVQEKADQKEVMNSDVAKGTLPPTMAQNEKAKNSDVAKGTLPPAMAQNEMAKNSDVVKGTLPPKMANNEVAKNSDVAKGTLPPTMANTEKAKRLDAKSELHNADVDSREASGIAPPADHKVPEQSRWSKNAGKVVYVAEAAPEPSDLPIPIALVMNNQVIKL